ncbi:hypothetical protein [Chitinophaga vietnamensis]|uniref:hypothetical protein n=1 Tax=Chitinophaga vietnamensis TaxID=2593957 RepID=UPI00117830F9|nr:hypothetical protein [Chitinophaga vietnamensis]
MKHITALCFSLLLAIFACAQNNAKTDMVIKTNGDILKVQVFKVSNSSISFRYPGETVENVVPTSEINRIVFASGREQQFNKNKSDAAPATAPANNGTAAEKPAPASNDVPPVTPGTVAIMPPYFTQEGAYRKDLSDLAQSHISDFIRKYQKRMKVTPMDIRVVNARLRGAGIDPTSINSYDIASLAQKTGAEYILMFDLFKTFKERQQTSTTSAERDRSNSSVTTTASDKDAYNISAQVSVYKNDGSLVYQRRVKPLDLGPELTFEDDIWKGYINFLMKRTPLYR